MDNESVTIRPLIGQLLPILSFLFVSFLVSISFVFKFSDSKTYPRTMTKVLTINPSIILITDIAPNSVKLYKVGNPVPVGTCAGIRVSNCSTVTKLTRSCWKVGGGEQACVTVSHRTTVTARYLPHHWLQQTFNRLTMGIYHVSGCDWLWLTKG